MPLKMPEKRRGAAFRPLGALVLLLLVAGAVAVYWHASGRIGFGAVVEESVISLSLGVPGSVSRIDVREGERVSRGQPLLFLDASAQRRALAEEEQKLAEFEALLPPQHARGTATRPYRQAPDAFSADEESLEQRLARQRKDEGAAERRLQAAAEYEAQAGIAYNRAVMMHSRKTLSAQERDAAMAALEDARQATRNARAALESLSLQRFGTSAEIRRVRDNQDAVGADTLPANLRIKNYELQRERTRAAAAALEATVLRAPEDGLVTRIGVRAGEALPAGAPCLSLSLLDGRASVVAEVSGDIAAKLRPGQQCRLEIAGASENSFSGHIGAVLPKAASQASAQSGQSGQSGARVLIAVTASAGNRGGTAGAEPLPYLPGGAEAEVTVLLRAPLVDAYDQAPSGPEADNLPAQHEPAAPKKAPAPAAPVENAPAPSGEEFSSPGGRLLPPVRSSEAQASPRNTAAGGPLEERRPLPDLPPMQPPARIPGAKQPDPANNPSLVTPEILEREAFPSRHPQ